MQAGRGSSLTEPYSLLRRCELFDHLGTDDIMRLAAGSRTIQLRRGNQVPAGGENLEVGYCVQGRLKVCHSLVPKKISLIGIIEPGELFGETALYLAADRKECAEALETALVMMLAASPLRALIDQSAELAHKMTVLVARRRCEVEMRLGRMLFRSNRERLVCLLLELAARYGTAVTEDGIEIGIKLSHQDLASIVGSTRETVTLILGQLQDEQLVELSRRRIRLLNVEGLAACMDGPTAPGNGRRRKRGRPKKSDAPDVMAEPAGRL